MNSLEEELKQLKSSTFSKVNNNQFHGFELSKKNIEANNIKKGLVIKSISKTSFIMNQFISKGNDIIVEAKVHLVFVNNQGKPIKIPEILFKNFKPFFCDSIKV